MKEECSEDKEIGYENDFTFIFNSFQTLNFIIIYLIHIILKFIIKFCFKFDYFFVFLFKKSKH